MKSTKKPADGQTIENDAAGQFANVKAGSKSSGVASAKPTVITGSEDATAHKVPPGEDAPKE
ncbi:hypothetical protein ABID21_003132 [Pseudorhizobium tarimense]|uniref:Uncharacterized protein n=1 Tax=Pseudorhizobium tarimense TaxID=1079109 RepID=A0ABV2H8Y1_9HYPH|nr:hypothetical protein [Pseudorhizobium tarimense]MCJ8520132.1 hypothetical protein [Pseudorhizobium tarimense]